MTRFRARWLFRGRSAPLENAVITIENGEIQAIDTHGTKPDVDLGEVALLPGLINAHTHLEFSDLAVPVEPRGDFAAWIRNVITQRRSRQAHEAEAVRSGLDESMCGGVTSLAEIATSDVALQECILGSDDPAPRMLVFREILGLNPDMIEPNLDLARTFVATARGSRVTDFGISPHAPYSLHPELFSRLCQFAGEHQLPVAMHLAESPAELELLDRGSGPLVDLFKQMGLWREGLMASGTACMDFLKALSELSRILLIHGNYLSDEEISFVAAHPRMSVVYCPRTHAAMQSDPHPWQKMIARGVNVCLGTDSRASNPDLRIWGELQFLSAKFPERLAAELLPLATFNAARALGWVDCGELAPGKAADLCVVSLSAEGVQNPQEFLFDGEIVRIMRCGRWTDRAGP